MSKLLTTIILVQLFIANAACDDGKASAKQPPIASATPLNSYVACGCGCCPDVKLKDHKCLYRSKGETLERIREEDLEASKRNSRLCATVGCSAGILYKYCD